MKHFYIFGALSFVVGACDVHHKSYYEYDSQDTAYSEADTSIEGHQVPTEEGVQVNQWVETHEDGTSTFSADVDSGSYSLARRALVEGRLPEIDTVRVEEFINYFHYDDPRPGDDLPFSVNLETAPSEFGDAEDIHMLRIGIQAKEIPEEHRDPVNLVFLLDVSGSMSAPDKLGLVQYAMKNLVDKLSPSDTLGIVVYAGSEGVVLEPTAVENKSEIMDALDELQAGGSTNGEAGIRTAYDLAESAFRSDGVNRVVLCTDGDMNVGLTGDSLIELVEQYRDRDIFLTTLGFGQGNYNDALMEQLADRGNGNYAYIDSPNEALRVLGENLVSTLQVVAKDVKIQVEFDSSNVERWRLVGYENRLLEDEDFANDAVDAGDIGAGHSVTALYELDLTDAPDVGNLAQVKLRYKEPTSDVSTEHAWEMVATERLERFEDASADFRFGVAVSEFAEILRHSPHSTDARFDDILSIGRAAAPEETRSVSKSEFLELVEIAQALSGE